MGDFIELPVACDLNLFEHLPIRPSNSGLAGYRIRDTPMDEDISDEYDFTHNMWLNEYIICD